MGVKDDLLEVPEREDGGQTAYDRFDYQTAWGLARLIELHDHDKNYGVAFEFHDDIVTLDDADTPTKVSFYQVKTKKSGNWSFAKITSRPVINKEKKSSFAGKMFDNFVRFGATVEKLVFVSNQPLPEVIVVHGEKSFSASAEKNLKKFVSSMATEIIGFDEMDHTKLFFFAFSDLNLTSYEQTIIGKIADFLERHIGPHIPAKPFALALNNECRHRAKSLADVTSFEQLKGSKFVTRSDMNKWLAHVKDQHDRRPECKRTFRSTATLPGGRPRVIDAGRYPQRVALQSCLLKLNGSRSSISASSGRWGSSVRIWRSHASGSTPQARQVSIRL